MIEFYYYSDNPVHRVAFLILVTAVQYYLLAEMRRHHG